MTAHRIDLTLFLLTLLFLGGCRGMVPATPTPLAEPAPIFLPASDFIAPLRIADLLNNPADYERSIVQVSGEYRRLPRLFCQEELFAPPTTWALAAGEIMIQARGFETVLRPLPAEGLTLTVAGQWQRWQGLVGCGQEAQQREIWLLEVIRVISPNPIVHVTAMPGALADTGTLPDPLATPTSEAIDSEEGKEEATPELAISPPVTEPGNGNGSLPTPLPPTPAGPGQPGISTPTPTFSAPIIVTPTPLATAVGATPAPGATETATPTPTGDNTPPAGPTATPNPSDQGTLEFDQVAKVNLSANTVHRWQLTVTNTPFLRVMVGPDALLDVGLTIRGPNGQLLATNQNSGAAGQVESVTINQPADGIYEILINQVGETPGHYAIAAVDDGAIPIIFAGSLTYGITSTGALPADNDHLWHFFGTAGELISIVITPQDNSDLAFGVYKPDMEEATSFIDANKEGEPEQLIDFRLLVTGFYTIWIQEFDYAAASYQISLTRK
jgi:hypothetical protein